MKGMDCKGACIGAWKKHVEKVDLIVGRNRGPGKTEGL